MSSIQINDAAGGWTNPSEHDRKAEQSAVASGQSALGGERMQLPGARSRESTTINHRTSTIKSEAKRNIAMGGWGFAAVKAAAEKKQKPAKAPRVKVKVDPKLVAAARELRDRWMEQINLDPTALPLTNARYEVSRGSDRAALGGHAGFLLSAA